MKRISAINPAVMENTECSPHPSKLLIKIVGVMLDHYASFPATASLLALHF